MVSEAPARRRLEGGPIPLCSGSPFCEAAAVAAAAAAGASDWVSESGTGANQRGQRTGGARHGFMKIWRKIEGKDLTLFCLYIPVPPPYFQGVHLAVF